jgi:hypothetical protein
METLRTVLMKRDPLEVKSGSRQLSLTCMLLICVHTELYENELILISRLSGKEFHIELVNSADNFQKLNDRLIFDGDRVSNTSDVFRLDNAEYNISEKDGVLRFEAETTNEDDGVRLWKGKVAGDTIEGVMVWAKTGRPVESYTFRGQKA